VRVRVLAGLLVLALLSSVLPHAAAAPSPPSLDARKQAAADSGLAYLAGVAAGQGATSDGMLEAIEGVGLDPGTWPSAEDNVLDRLYIPAVGTPGNDPIREIEAYAQTGYDLHPGGRDLVAELRQAWDGSAQGVGQAAFTVLGLHAAGLPDADATIQDAAATLRSGQATGGFWVCDAALPPQDVDCTGFALTALASVHALTPGVASLSKAFLDGSRNPDGGYEEHPDQAHPGPSNTDSTIWAINAYRAIGAPEPQASWDFILDRQDGDGSFQWQGPGEQAITRTFATKEVLASLWSSFATWPTTAHTVPSLAAAHANVPATFGLDGFGESVAWSAQGDGAGPVEASGARPQLTFPTPGDWTLHVDAHSGATHERLRIPVTVGNDPPAFHGPDAIDAWAGQPFALDPRASDPEGQPVEVTWTLGDRAGRGDLQATLDAPGVWTATFAARDPFGASANLTVAITVHPAMPPSSPDAVVPGGAPALPAAEADATGTDPDPSVPQPATTPSLAPTTVPVPPPHLAASWSLHDGVVDVAASADAAYYLTLAWCDLQGCHEQAVVEGHAFLPAGLDLTGVTVQARLDGKESARQALGDIPAAASATAPAAAGPPRWSTPHAAEPVPVALGWVLDGVVAVLLAGVLVAVARRRPGR